MKIVNDDKTTHVPTSVGNDLDLLAERALEFVQPGSTVGLGSGRAARVVVRALGRRAQRGLTITCVATSEVTARLAAEVGLRAVKLDETPPDLTVDGADEVDPDLNALKGFGGALVRERIVAAASRRQILLIRAEKLVPALGRLRAAPGRGTALRSAVLRWQAAAAGVRAGGPAGRWSAVGHRQRQLHARL